MLDREWLVTDEVAVWLRVSVEDVKAEIERGGIPALVVGDHVRVSRQALLARAGFNAALPDLSTSQATRADGEVLAAGIGVPEPAGFLWCQDIDRREPFTHGWPRTGGGQNPEHYEHAWQATVSLHGQTLTVKIGETVRDGRGRLVIWLGPTVVAEFVETLAGEWASLIRLFALDGRKRVLPMGETRPPLYRGVRIEPYQEATGRSGSGVPRGAAIVIAHDDLRSAVHHTAARWLSWQHLPLEPTQQSAA